MGATAAGDCIRRARRAGLSWPLAEDVSDGALEARLYPPPASAGMVERPQPDWPTLHRELKRPGVTLQLLWEELDGPSMRKIKATQAEAAGPHRGPSGTGAANSASAKPAKGAKR